LIRGSLWRLGLAGLLCAGLLIAPVPGAADAQRLTVFAAASLKNALDAVAADWESQASQKPVISYAATSALAKQIAQGAEADIFISADQGWMDYVAEQGLIVPETRCDLLANRLVLIAPKDSDLTAEIAPGFPLAKLLGDGRLAIAGVDAVPAGKYGKAALQSLGVWEQVKDRLAQSENVRAALRLVSRKETPLGIVYASDAKADPTVKVLGVFPEDSHPPIVYPAARLAGSAGPRAVDFLVYLRSPAARRRFEENGFAMPGSPAD
jgi:molybdate transport system substrate-binding protein